MPSPYHTKADPWSSHSIILQWLSRFPAGTKILDVGTATGIFGRLCADRQFILNGVEPVMGWAESARPYYNELRCDFIGDTPSEFLSGYEVVICGDILEHLPDPESALNRLVSLQKQGSVFLISVPNVANLWVRINLLFGKFDYAKRGILDRTHLRFLTLKSLIHLLEASGLVVEEMRVTPVPLNLISSFWETTLPGRTAHQALAWITRRLPTLLGYQFVARCSKGN